MTPVRCIAVAGVCLAVAAAGCGGNGSAEDQEVTQALTGMYVIDHGSASPTGDALAPYQAAFRRIQETCGDSPSKLANGVVDVADEASNGSGTTITNLDVLRALVHALDDDNQDCAGLLVGVEARLEGAALGG